MGTLAVLTVSDSFAAEWPALAAAAGLACTVHGADDAGWHGFARAVAGDAVGLVAAGGEELRAIDALASHAPGGRVVVAGAAADHRLAVQAVRAGADDYLALPHDLDVLRAWLGDAAQRLAQRAQARGFTGREEARHSFDAILGTSPALRAAIDTALRVIPRPNVTVLLQGETGTGKELFARAIHYGGPRASAPFVDVNCTAIPATLLESELFGHEAGAFTDARTARPGLLEAADGGTLFLDEIGHLPLELQAKLLRVLEERTVRRVGGARSVPFDVRVIAATHVDLADAVRRGAFREDLWYRLNVLPITLPPLRARRDDIVPLAEAFVRRFAAEYGIVPAPVLSPAAIRALESRAWPGNVRELRNAIERALLLADGPRLEPHDLPDDRAAARAVDAAGAPLPWPATLDELERAATRAMLAECRDNKSETARRLGISRPRLQRLLATLAPAGPTTDDHDDA